MLRHRSQTDKTLGSIARITASSPGRSEAIPFTMQKNSGWHNLITIVAGLSILRYIILNLMEFGFIMKMPLSDINFVDSAIFCVFFIFNAMRCALIFITAHHRRLALFFLAASEVGLSVLILFRIKYVYLSGWAHIISIATDLKLFSFLMSSNQATPREFAYFMVVPTLVYRNSYIMKKRTNYRLVLLKIMQFALYFFAAIFVMDQYAVPSIYKAVRSKTYFICIESMINVSISTILFFNLFFQLVFGCLLTVLSELTRFDEAIYSEWWDSMSAGDFWSKWNMPMHYFIKKHMYSPMRRRGISPAVCKTLCFVFSGIIHELVVSLSTKTRSGWFFLAMILQIPLIYISEWVKRRFPRHANIFFWFSFCVIGQPLTALLLVRSFYIFPQGRGN